MINLKTWIKKEPYSIILFLTNRCNSKCSFCNIWKENPKVDIKAWDFKQILRRSSLLKNVKQFVITGGECTFNKDFVKIVDTIMLFCDPYKISISSNGLNTKLIDIADELSKKYGKDKFRFKISFDGKRETYKKLRGVNGYDIVKNSIKTLLNRGFDVSIGFTATEENYKELPDIRKQFGNIVIAHPADSVALYKSNSNFKGLLPKIKHKNLFFKLYHSFTNKTMKKRKRIHKCYAGSVSAVIDCNLNVFSCIKNPFSFGNLQDYNLDFDVLWYNNIKKIRKQVGSSNCYCYCTGDVIPSLIRDFRWLL